MRALSWIFLCSSHTQTECYQASHLNYLLRRFTTISRPGTRNLSSHRWALESHRWYCQRPTTDYLGRCIIIGAVHLG